MQPNLCWVFKLCIIIFLSCLLTYLSICSYVAHYIQYIMFCFNASTIVLERFFSFIYYVNWVYYYDLFSFFYWFFLAFALMWPTIFNTLCFALILQQIVLAGFFIIKGWIPGIVFNILTALLVFLFALRTNKKYEITSCSYFLKINK